MAKAWALLDELNAGKYRRRRGYLAVRRKSKSVDRVGGVLDDSSFLIPLQLSSLGYRECRPIEVGGYNLERY